MVVVSDGLFNAHFKHCNVIFGVKVGSYDMYLQ